jgi:hypothetical protein
MANKWIKHLQQFRQKNKGMDARDLMKEARKSYQGGGEVTPYSQTNLASTASDLKQQGGRRRKSQKRRTSRSNQKSRRQTRRR